MSLAGDGELSLEPTVGERRKTEIKAQLRKRAEARLVDRQIAGAMWLVFGGLLVAGVFLTSLGMELSWAFLAAVTVLTAAGWAGVTAVLIVRQS